MMGGSCRGEGLPLEAGQDSKNERDPDGFVQTVGLHSSETRRTSSPGGSGDNPEPLARFFTCSGALPGFR